ncbi:MAG: quinol:electron acceptor oxidoreductase subunit ActD [Planctomycetota bacterium]
MSEPKKEKKPAEPKSHGWMAEYDCDHKLLDACRKVRDSGYTKTDAFTPFPIHGIDEALGIKPTVLPWFTFFAGFTGTCTALTMQYYFNAVDYPYIISGKPFASWPAFIPVTFELTVLFAAFTTVFAMLGLNGLPKFSNPVFSNPRFDRVTDDRFFLWIDASDQYYNSDKVRALLADTGPLEVEEVMEDDTPDAIPRKLLITIFTGIAASLIPLVIVMNMRNSKSGASRLHVFFDMDYQPKRKTQTPTTIFENNRVQQPPVPGTVAMGELDFADPYYLGYDPDKTVALNEASAETRFVSLQDEEGSENEAAAAEAPPKLAFLDEFPDGVVTDEMFDIGKAKFEQVCAACHGFSGYGDGLVSQRANNIGAANWANPTSLHSPTVRPQPVGQIYHTIANGKGKMGSYGPTLNPKERWAVVLYVKTLQRSQDGEESDIPTGATVEELDLRPDAAKAKPAASNAEPGTPSEQIALPEKPATAEPAVEEPASEDPAATDTTEKPAETETPAAEPEKPAEEPATEEPDASETPAEEPAAEEPSTEEPATSESTTSEEPPAEEPAKESGSSESDE